MNIADPIHLLLVGTLGTEFRLAAAMAQTAGAQVTMADCTGTALARLRDQGGDLVMIDIDQDIVAFIRQLRSERIAVPVLACGIDATAAQAVAAIRAGARDYVPLPPQADLIAAAILSVAYHGSRLIADDPAMARAVALALAMAHSHAPILLMGEAGCGKEMLARTVHGASGRRGKFLVVDCAGHSLDVLRSELFGHAEGAFAGAIAGRRGRIDEAADGTLFLRDVDALSGDLQAGLLSVLQGHHGHRQGSDPTAHTARIVAGTRVDLDALVAESVFNATLLARLGLVRIALPPLRARPGDIVAMACHFAERFALANQIPVRRFDPSAIHMLRHHDWAGNVRELEDTVHRAVLLNREAEIGVEAIVDVDGRSLGAAPAVDAMLPAAVFVGRTVDDMERELILQTLRHCRGNRTSASTILGISVRTMRNKLKTFIEAGIAVSPAL